MGADQHVWAELPPGSHIARRTKAALLVKSDVDDSFEVWLPIRLVDCLCYVSGGDTQEFIDGEELESVCIPQWLADERQLDYDTDGSDGGDADSSDDNR